MYEKIYADVVQLLAANDERAAQIGQLPFRKRSEHTWRVFCWAKRLLAANEGRAAIDAEALLVAALFHDAGYALSLDGKQHASNSAALFEDYAQQKGLFEGKRERIAHLIRNHSSKRLLNQPDTPLELVILMEADLLDETGALAILWDCMDEGAKAGQSFEKTYGRIAEFSGKFLHENPMQTAPGKAFWAEKQRLMREFLHQLAVDLALDEGQAPAACS